MLFLATGRPLEGLPKVIVGARLFFLEGAQFGRDEGRGPGLSWRLGLWDVRVLLGAQYVCSEICCLPSDNL